MSQSNPAEQATRVTTRGCLQHHLNPLHFYCRLRDWGFSGRTAFRLCFPYERLYKIIFRVSPEM